MSLSTWPIGQKWNMPRGAFIGSVPGTIGHVLHVVSRILGHVRSWRHRKGVLTHVRIKWSFADPPQATSVCQWDPHTQSENVLNAFKCRVRKRNSSQRFMQIYAGSIRCRSGGTNPLEEWHLWVHDWPNSRVCDRCLHFTRDTTTSDLSSRFCSFKLLFLEHAGKTVRFCWKQHHFLYLAESYILTTDPKMSSCLLLAEGRRK